MKIVEHTATRLILQDSAQMLWVTKILSAICLIWSAGNFFRGIVNPSSLSFLIVIHIVFSLIFSMGWALFYVKGTVCFDQELEKVTLINESALKQRAVEYSLDEIINVKAEVKLDSEGSSYNVVLTVASRLEPIPLSRITFISADYARETTKLVREFLNLPE